MHAGSQIEAQILFLLKPCDRFDFSFISNHFSVHLCDRRNINFMAKCVVRFWRPLERPAHTDPTSLGWTTSNTPGRPTSVTPFELSIHVKYAEPQNWLLSCFKDSKDITLNFPVWLNLVKSNHWLDSHWVYYRNSSLVLRRGDKGSD